MHRGPSESTDRNLAAERQSIGVARVDANMGVADLGWSRRTRRQATRVHELADGREERRQDADQEVEADIVRIPICGSAWMQNYNVKD